MKRSFFHLIPLTALACLLASCANPQPGPDKTLGGTVLGAGWGAGAGAVVGNQLGSPGEGVAIGAGFGAVQGAMIGGGLDTTESAMLAQEKELSTLQALNAANRAQLGSLIAMYDNSVATDVGNGIYQVFFDPDATSLRKGAVANLEVIAASIQKSPRAHNVHVVGHTDDTGDPKHNERLAEARAKTVGDYLAARGISMDQITVKSQGAKQPIATNATQVGRQLNRRVDVYITPDR